ncbi:MAG: monofunctional biosynthetic peptidoglycan transglycosylase, partial [Saprospiraceae bacterium]
MIYRSTGQLFHGEPIKMKKDWVPLGKISRNLQLAVICSEDQNFAEHAGFDWKAIDKAMSENEKRVKRGKTIRGASTISQQCAKNVFLTPNRTWIRKIFEVYFTVLIETLWSKERILEVYLNVIEMGKGIYGSEAAANEYFGKKAKNLSREEAARIAAILPNPRKYSAVKPTPYIQKRSHWIQAQMRAYGTLELDN